MLLFSSTDAWTACSGRFSMDVIRSMTDDIISFIVKRDSLILSCGSFVYTLKGKPRTAYLLQKMIMLARLLKEIYNTTSQDSKSLNDFLCPNIFGEIVAD